MEIRQTAGRIHSNKKENQDINSSRTSSAEEEEDFIRGYCSRCQGYCNSKKRSRTMVSIAKTVGDYSYGQGAGCERVSG
jgi:hypothetical protein